MGPTLRVCLDALDKPEMHSDSSLGELHILERTSLKFLAQNCILAEAPNLTRLKVSGSLPSLQVNVCLYSDLLRFYLGADACARAVLRPQVQVAHAHDRRRYSSVR